MNNKLLLNKHIILGLSGGADSIYLFHKLLELKNSGKITFICAHLNHGWRDESDNDEEFCKRLCEKHNVPLISEHASSLDAIKYNGSKEEVGRILRKKFFNNILDKTSANYIALAHHADDQQETFFWRIIRGSSLDGLTCMNEVDGKYVRPLINTYKKDILKYLDDNNLQYVDDLTNQSDDFLRNRIRKYVIPAMRKCDDRFDKKFSDTLLNLQEENDFLIKLTLKAYNNVFDKKVGNLKLFLELDTVIQKRLLVLWLSNSEVKFSPSKSYLNEILRFLCSPRGGAHQLGHDWTITKKKNQFYIH